MDIPDTKLPPVWQTVEICSAEIKKTGALLTCEIFGEFESFEWTLFREHNAQRFQIGQGKENTLEAAKIAGWHALQTWAKMIEKEN